MFLCCIIQTSDSQQTVEAFRCVMVTSGHMLEVFGSVGREHPSHRQVAIDIYIYIHIYIHIHDTFIYIYVHTYSRVSCKSYCREQEEAIS